MEHLHGAQVDDELVCAGAVLARVQHLVVVLQARRHVVGVQDGALGCLRGPHSSQHMTLHNDFLEQKGGTALLAWSSTICWAPLPQRYSATPLCAEQSCQHIAPYLCMSVYLPSCKGASMAIQHLMGSRESAPLGSIKRQCYRVTGQTSVRPSEPIMEM